MTSDDIDAESAAIRELLQMSREEIDLVQYTPLKWVCCVKGCNNGTRVRDYGIAPMYWSQRIVGNWTDITVFVWFCGKHNKLRRRLEKLYTKEHISRRIIDFDKDYIINYGKV